jgi:hypothetical protein
VRNARIRHGGCINKGQIVPTLERAFAQIARRDGHACHDHEQD